MSLKWTGAALAVMLCLLPAAPAEAGRPYDALRQRLVQDGFDADYVAGVYAHEAAAFDLSAAAVYFRHREAKVDYSQFRDAASLDRARAYLKAHAQALNKAERTYGVDKEIITAILLVETRLGAVVGSRKVVNTLSTLAALSEKENRDRLYEDPAVRGKKSRAELDAWAARKSRWAYRELKAFLTHTRRSGGQAAEIPGSFAGALGLPQFMPTSLEAYGADGDGDGRVDLFVHADAIASIARYLRGNGWKSGMDEKKMSKVLLTYNNSSYYVETLLKIRSALKKGGA